MGNNGSSSREQRASSTGLPRSESSLAGWSQSFPRHRSTDARKVLPEPPGQRLRSTDNGSIIQNGGTISGRKPPSSRDHLKDDPFRARSTSASSIGEPARPRNHPARANLRPRRFGSEPDLRCSPDTDSSIQDRKPKSRTDIRQDGRRDTCRRVDKERSESRYRARKKYKAPAPPASGDPRYAEKQQLQPPPRRCRLFKTRAESKKTQLDWQATRLDPSSPGDRSDDNESPVRATDRVRLVNDHRRYHQDRQRHSRQRAKLLDGRSTLQRSLSSPEFQAELMQAARRVRDKLDSGEKTEPGLEGEFRSLDRCSLIEDRPVPDEPNVFAAVEQSRDLAPDWPGSSATRTSQREPTDVHRPNGNFSAERRERDASKLEDRHRRRVDHSEMRPDFQKMRAEYRAVAGKENSDPRRWNDSEREREREREREPHRKRSNDKGKWMQPVQLEDRRRENIHAFVSSSESPRKMFYFGMNETLPSESRTSNSVAIECSAEDTDDNGKSVIEDISLKLRPTLPKKQLEIPRFSPSAAWRLLETPGPSTSTASEEMPVMLEERIERLSRPPPPLIAVGPRSLHDKSGDSGISGDAGAAIEDSLDVSTLNRTKAGTRRPAWTPQQDLGEESSSDAGVDSPPPLVKYAPRAHVFSLSLPRDDGAKPREGSAAFNSLQRLKRSVSGAFGIIGTQDLRKKCTREILDDNWLLSTSAPTSLQHSHAVEPPPPSGWKADDETEDGKPDFPTVMKAPSFSYLAPGGHVMYLPESSEAEHRVQSLNGRRAGGADNEQFANRPPNRLESNESSSLLETEALAGRDPLKKQSQPRSKRFTFQSTVRQIERRRLAEKLSREAEAKERQRKGELEAMRKVEEEFERKRAKEKASIKQQLRLFKELEENFDSLPVEWDGARADPDGAPSSTASSPTSLPTVDELPSASGGKPITPQRRTEQISYRPKYYDWPPDADKRGQTTVHPKIVCDIPKNSANLRPGKRVTSTSAPRSDNYRKDFAHGTVIARSSFASSDSELSQPNARPRSRQAGIKSKPHRSRSASPERGVCTANSGEDAPVEAVKRPRNPTQDFVLNGLQPFVKEKTYRPISFNPQPPSIPS